MKIDRIKAYSFEILLLLILLFCTFTSSSNTKFILMVTSFIGAIVLSFMLKKEPNTYTNKKNVFWVMVLFAIFYIALFYILGIYTGYFKSLYPFSVKTILNFIIPISVNIVCSEIIRNKLLTVDTKTSKILTIIIMTMMDVLLYLYIYDITKIMDFLAIVGFLFFSSLASNMLFNYINPRYGKKGIIVYKLITTLYMYILPVVPDVYMFFRTFMRMVYPLFIYLYLENYYNTDKEQVLVKDKKKTYASYALTFIIIIPLILLISCKFLYGALVIGSGSMKGSLDLGDVVIFNSSMKDLKVGDIIVFKKDDIKIVHRISKIKYAHNRYEYYTKGDANQYTDDGYVTQDDLLGKVVVKIPKIGMPTLWLREQFK